jgi:hypothetical protein
MPDPTKLVLPSKVPWQQLTGKALEELLYWLCDALGANDLEWRAGSLTGTSRDRGRDLEATFNVPEPDGELRPERWWVQAKGRTATVEPAAVKEAVVEVQAVPDVDVLVIATNSRFSNDARDWVHDFQAGHPRPRIQLWDRERLERMVARQPAVVARVAPQALSPKGRIEAASEAFWNRQELPSVSELGFFWERRSELEFETRDLLALIVGEAAVGDLLLRPWAPELDTEDLVPVLLLALLNLGPLLLRLERSGVPLDPVQLGVGHLIAAALVRLRGDKLVELLRDPWSYGDPGPSLDEESREKLRDLLIQPVLSRLASYLGTACMEDCVRVMGELEPEDARTPEHRWLSLLPSSVARDDLRGDPRLLTIEKLDAPCNAGLKLSPDHGCPFVAVDDRPWEELIPELQAVLVSRLAEAADERAAGRLTTPEAPPEAG